MRNDVVKCDVKDAILDAAEHLLGLYGYKKTTVDDIAQEAGIGKGTIYLHFHSKEEIAVSWIDRVNRGVRERLEEIAASEDSASERIRRMLIARVMVRLGHARNHDKSLDDLLAAIRPLLLTCRHRWHEAESEILARVLKEGQEQGECAPVDAKSAARMLLLATNSLLPYSLSARQLGEPKEIEETAGRMAELLLNGLMVRL